MQGTITPVGYGRMFNAALKSGLVGKEQITGLLGALEDMGMGFHTDAIITEFKQDSDRAKRYKEMATDLYCGIEQEVEFDKAWEPPKIIRKEDGRRTALFCQ